MLQINTILTQGIISKFRYAGFMICSDTGLATKDKTEMTTKNKYDDLLNCLQIFLVKKHPKSTNS